MFAIWVGLLLCGRRAPASEASDGAARLVILANANDPESIALAQYYAERRGVPRRNLVALPMAATGTITWHEYVAQIHEPLLQFLIGRGMIDALPSDLRDAFGRKRRAISGHRISYLVVCRGVPWRIGHDPAVTEKAPSPSANPGFLTNQAAVDSELSLLANGTSRGVAFEANPLFAKDRPSFLDASAVIRVSRLDAPTAAQARRVVDSALAAEREGARGRYYVDLGGPTAAGDKWLEAAALQLAAAGLKGERETTAATFSGDAKLPDALFYLGWYAPSACGPFAREDFAFSPGAVALHIHSFSATDLRSTTEGWCGALVACGAAATFGNVFEPYLQLTLRPDLLVRALLRGGTLGEAAYYATPVLSWQGVVIGDPLYRPFPGGRKSTATGADSTPVSHTLSTIRSAKP